MADGMAIGARRIGRDHPPLVIAEMSGNHNGSLERALTIVDAAAGAGADAIKLQTYTADSMTLDIDAGEFRITDPSSPWAGSSLHRLYSTAATPWEWHQPLFERAAHHGLLAFSTPFDGQAVDALETLGVPCYKIASFENTDLRLIRRVAATGKPVVLSTGMASAEEVEEAVSAARAAGCRDLILLKCTSTYPAPPQHSNLRTIPDMRARFGCEVGVSDHTPGIGVAIAAVACGATVIEKHLTLARSDGGVDAAFSLEPAEMAQLTVEARRAWESIGQVAYGPTDADRASLQFRRSLYIVRDVRAGEAVTLENVRAIRPGLGLPPKFLDELIGRTFSRDARRGTPLSWSVIS